MQSRSLHARGELPISADINVTSLVDVAFVLLIIFMITAPIMQGGVDVQLPRGEARPIEPREGLIITVDQNGRIFIGDDQTALTYEEFRGSFQALVNTRERGSGVYLRGDGRASYRDVVRVLAVIQAAGVDNAGIVLEDEDVRR